MSDFDDILEAEKGMTAALDAVQRLITSSRYAQEYLDQSGELRKIAKSNLIVEYLDSGAGVGEAEHRATADARYLARLREISLKTIKEGCVVEHYKLEGHKYEAARSILAVRRAQIGIQ
jgi:hypothetical protein